MTRNQGLSTHTGDIAAQPLGPSREYTAESQEISFSDEQHAIWGDLFAGIHQPYQMEFTPEPDMFHDIFGHLPYLTLEFYARIEDKFAPAYLKASQAEREDIKRLAWYSTEFGLLMQDNRFKVFGAGTISGRSELTSTIMEFYRLGRDDVIDYRGDVFEQLQDHFLAHRDDIQRIIEGINELHQGGQMSSQERGWNVVHALYEKPGIKREGYLGGDVIFAPFDLDMIARIPKTVYAFNPMFFVCESFERMDALLDTYLKPIALRN